MVGELIVAVHTHRDPSDAEWSAYYAEIVKHDLKHLKSLVFTEGGGPDTAQRKQVDELPAGRRLAGVWSARAASSAAS